MPSEGSRRGTGFIAANVERIPIQGEVTLNLIGESGAGFKSVFQACKLNRPLWSVSRICDSGYEVLFTAKGAIIRRPGSNSPVCGFEKQNGLYVGKLQLKKPDTPVFRRQG